MELLPEADYPSPRRAWLSKVGVGMIAAMAGILARREDASAHYFHSACCHLANPPGTGTCASGTFFSWTCCNGTYLYQCVECWDRNYCDRPASCFNGCFYKSYAVNLSTAC